MDNSIETPDNRLADQLERLLISLTSSSRMLVPNTQDELLRSIVETAARIFEAAAASIALVDEREETLVFKVAYGAGNDSIEGLNIPMDSGIAGYVALTGQPIAVSDVSHDPRFHKSFAESTGYVPRSILATPLLSGERVIGVMEVLDKIEAPSFNLKDMELLGLFAHQAAIAIQLSQQIDQFGLIFLNELKKIIVSDQNSDSAELLGVVEKVKRHSGRDTELTRLVSVLAQLQGFGNAELQTSLRVLEALVDYRLAQTRYSQ